MPYTFWQRKQSWQVCNCFHTLCSSLYQCDSSWCKAIDIFNEAKMGCLSSESNAWRDPKRPPWTLVKEQSELETLSVCAWLAWHVVGWLSTPYSFLFVLNLTRKSAVAVNWSYFLDSENEVSGYKTYKNLTFSHADIQSRYFVDHCRRVLNFQSQLYPCRKNMMLKKKYRLQKFISQSEIVLF